MASIPTVSEFTRELKREGIHWYSLGQDLGLSTETLDCIQDQVAPGDSEGYLAALYNGCKGRCPSWSELVEALRGQGHHTIADTITDKYSLPPSPAGNTIYGNTYSAQHAIIYYTQLYWCINSVPFMQTGSAA